MGRKKFSEPPHVCPVGVSDVIETRVGPFFSFRTITTPTIRALRRISEKLRHGDIDCLAKVLLLFQDTAETELERAHVATSKADGKLSLRILIWYFLSYVREHRRRVLSSVPSDDCSRHTADLGELFDYYSRSLGNKWFGAYRNGDRVAFKDSEGRTFVTCVAPINLFLFMIHHNIIDDFKSNYDDVVSHELAHNQKARDARVHRDRKRRASTANGDGEHVRTRRRRKIMEPLPPDGTAKRRCIGGKFARANTAGRIVDSDFVFRLCSDAPDDVFIDEFGQVCKRERK